MTALLAFFLAAGGGGPTLSPPEWSLGVVRHNARFDVEVALDPAGAEYSVFLPCSCLSWERLGSGRFRLTLFTQGLLGSFDYSVQVVVTESGRTSIARFPVRFEVPSRRPAAAGPPDLLLRYRPEDRELLIPFADVSRALGGTEEARRAEVTELVDRERTTAGRDEVRRRLLELGAAPEPEFGAGGPASGRRILFFYPSDCPSCRWLKTRFLPPLARDHGFAVDARPIDVEENLRILWALLRKHGREDAGSTAVAAGDRLFVGVDEIRNLLPRYLAQKPALGAVDAAPADLEAEFTGIAAVAVALAGLVDGINPCAFATAVFLLSFLSFLGYRRGAALAVGAAYAGAVFVTYFALGLALFAAARSLAAAEALRYVVAGLALVLALVSLWDASRYAATGDGVTLQLPRGIKAKIHEVIRTRLRAGFVVLGAAAAGVLVTLLEAVCTGQVYLPTIVAMTRHEGARDRAVLLLLLYNAAFLLPLVVMMVATVSGLSSKRLAEWSRRNVVVAKAAMALLFLGLAAYLLV